MSIGNFLTVRTGFWLEQLRVIRRYYPRSLTFARLDLSLGLMYLVSNPYRLCRRFLQKRGESDVDLYGETPLTTWERIARFANIKEDDVLLDLGCGRGKLCFWSSCFIGCRSIGFDWVPTFIRRARRLSHPLVRFHCSSLRLAPLGEATVVYLYTFHPEEESLDFSRLRRGSRVLTVSEPLKHKDFNLKGALVCDFPWGDSKVFLNVKIV